MKANIDIYVPIINLNGVHFVIAIFVSVQNIRVETPLVFMGLSAQVNASHRSTCCGNETFHNIRTISQTLWQHLHPLAGNSAAKNL